MKSIQVGFVLIRFDNFSAAVGDQKVCTNSRGKLSEPELND